MMKLKEKMNMFLVIALLCSLSVGAVAEGTLMTIQAMKRATAFSEDTILQEDLDMILKAGISTVNQLDRQGWQFAAITDASVLDSIAADTEAALADAQQSDSVTEEIMEKTQDIARMIGEEPALNDAPAAIVIYVDNTASPNAAFDCGAAAQNMMHTANVMGYATSIIIAPLCILNGENHDALCMQFGIDPAMNAVAMLLVGAAAEASAAEYNIDELMLEKVSYVQ